MNAFYPDATQEQKLIITKLSLEADSSVYVFENDPTNSLEDLFELLELRYGNSQVDSKLSPVPVQTKQSIQALSNYPINFDSKSFADMLRSMPKLMKMLLLGCLTPSQISIRARIFQPNKN